MTKLSLLILFISFSFSETFIIASKIVDNENNPIENANIYCKEEYTKSNNEGYFTLRCKENENIKISHINYQTIELTIKSIPKIVVLINKNIKIDDVIIYGGLNNNYKTIISLIYDKKNNNYINNIFYSICFNYN